MSISDEILSYFIKEKIKNQLFIADIFNIHICVVMGKNFFKTLPAFRAAAGACLAKAYAMSPSAAVENKGFCVTVFKNGFNGKISASK